MPSVDVVEVRGKHLRNNTQIWCFPWHRSIKKARKSCCEEEALRKGNGVIPSRSTHQRFDGHELDQDVKGWARRVLEGVANSVANDGSLVAVAALAPKLAGMGASTGLGGGGRPGQETMRCFSPYLLQRFPARNRAQNLASAHLDVFLDVVPGASYTHKQGGGNG